MELDLYGPTVGVVLLDTPESPVFGAIILETPGPGVLVGT